jgi:hypothetical protein
VIIITNFCHKKTMEDTQTESTQVAQPKIQVARSLIDYSASWYAYGKGVLPVYAASQLQSVEKVVVDQVTTRVDPDALLNVLDIQIDGAVQYSAGQVMAVKKKVDDVKARVDTVRNQAVDSAQYARSQLELTTSDVYHRVTTSPAVVSDQLQGVKTRIGGARDSVTVYLGSTLEAVKDQAVQRADAVKSQAVENAVYGITCLLDASEAGVNRLLPEVETEESKGEGCVDKEDEGVPVPASLSPLVPRIRLLSHTVSKRVLKRVEAQLGGAPLKLRANVEELVHVNLMEYADKFMQGAAAVSLSTSGAASALSASVSSSVESVATVVKGRACTLKDTVSGTVTTAIAASPLETTWAAVRQELLVLQKRARHTAATAANPPACTSSEGEGEGEGVSCTVEEEHEALVLSELALALRLVVLPALVSWVSASMLSRLPGHQMVVSDEVVPDESKEAEAETPVSTESM